MGNIDKYMQGRTEGMEFALRLARDKGIEALEKEVRFRNKTGISLNCTTQELNVASEKIKEMTLDTVLIAAIAVLHDEWGFSTKRCQRFQKKFIEAAELLVQDMATWDDYINEISKQIKLDLKIRWRDI